MRRDEKEREGSISRRQVKVKVMRREREGGREREIEKVMKTELEKPK